MESGGDSRDAMVGVAETGRGPEQQSATDNGLGTNAIVRELGTTKNTVWRWRDRFHEQGVDGLLHDKTRPSRILPIEADQVQKVIDLTLGPPLGEATHWTGRAMVEASGLSLSSIQRIWRAHGLAPHRWRQFKLSRDPAFADKLQDIVGLYVDPPAHAVVLSIDEKSQIQALDRTQPGLPMKPGRCGTMTHDYKRHGTTTLFAALNILDGTVIGRNMQRHRHQEFIRFLNEIDRIVPASRTIHAIVDNYATHKHKKVRAWLARHPRWTFHFTPTSCNAVELCQADQTPTWRVPFPGRPPRSDQPLRHGAQPGLSSGADPNDIIASVKRGFQETQTTRRITWSGCLPRANTQAMLAAISIGLVEASSCPRN